MSDINIIEIEPRVTINEADASGIDEVKEGDRVQVIMSYKVIEKTKNFIVFKIPSIYKKPTRRV